MKSAEEIMKILDAYDLTGSLRDAGELAGCSHHTVKHYVDRRAAGGELDQAAARPQLIDEYLPKVEEWVERSFDKVRADVAHDKLVALGYKGSERTTRRAVAKVKASYRSGRVRVHRPWITEPGMWLQYDYGDGPVVDGVKTVLFVAWLAWSRFRVVIALRDKTMPSVFAALDQTFRRLGGVPTYVLTDDKKTVTTEHIAGIPVRNQQLVTFAEHYSVVVHTCVPADPASKGGTEASVKISKADLVPKDTNLREEYASFAELEAACEAFCQKVNTRAHRITKRPPLEMLAEERARLHPVPAQAHTVAFGTTRVVPANTPMVTFESGQYSVSHTLAWQPEISSIPAPTQQALRTLEWVHRRGNLVVCGPSGTGKTFLLEALGQQAVEQGLKVAWFTLEDLGVLLRRHRADDTVTKAIARILRADLVIVDDIGLLAVAADAAEGLYRLVDAAYEKRSVAISSNLHPSGFDELMPKTLATATVDRLLHHAHVCQTSGDSVRLTQALAGQGVSPLS